MVVIFGRCKGPGQLPEGEAGLEVSGDGISFPVMSAMIYFITHSNIIKDLLKTAKIAFSCLASGSVVACLCTPDCKNRFICVLYAISEPFGLDRLLYSSGLCISGDA